MNEGEEKRKKIDGFFPFLFSPLHRGLFMYSVLYCTSKADKKMHKKKERKRNHRQR
jgi:hypothetical protein